MNTFKKTCIASLLVATGIAQASTPCNGFEIKVRNNLADNLVATTIRLDGAEIQPGSFQKLDSKTEQVFTVNNSNDNVPMAGTMHFHTISLPSKEVKVHFELKNNGLVCEHTDTSPDSDYSVSKTRLPGKVSYSIENK